MEVVFIGKLQSGSYVVRFGRQYWLVHIRTQVLEPVASVKGFFNSGVFVQTDPAEMKQITDFIHRRDYIEAKPK
jgi:hypothetical protein